MIHSDIVISRWKCRQINLETNKARKDCLSQILYLSKRNTTNIETAMLFINHSYRVEEPTNINEAYLDLHVVIILHKLKCCHINDEASPAPETTGGAPLVARAPPLSWSPAAPPAKSPSWWSGHPLPRARQSGWHKPRTMLPPLSFPFPIIHSVLNRTDYFTSANMSDCHISCVINTPW